MHKFGTISNGTTAGRLKNRNNEKQLLHKPKQKKKTNSILMPSNQRNPSQLRHPYVIQIHSK